MLTRREAFMAGVPHEQFTDPEDIVGPLADPDEDRDWQGALARQRAQDAEEGDDSDGDLDDDPVYDPDDLDDDLDDDELDGAA